MEKEAPEKGGKKRGRPKKETTADDSPKKEGRKRGRPKKDSQ